MCEMQRDIKQMDQIRAHSNVLQVSRDLTVFKILPLLYFQ